jgi:hypothetical protein
MRAGLSVLVGLLVVATVAVPGGFALATTVATPGLHLSDAFGSTAVSSYNWAGYAATGANGTVTKVSGAWVQPAVTCSSGQSLAAFWVGIDGFNSGTVEQDGSLAWCSGGVATYYVWWETYPANAVQTWATISAGDHISASVTYHASSGMFTMALKDTTSGGSWTKSSANHGALESSAECIAERPAGASNSSGLYALSKFKTEKFTSCKATIAGTSGGIGTFTSYAITMVSYPSGTRTLASVSGLTGNSKFTVTWHHAS